MFGYKNKHAWNKSNWTDLHSKTPDAMWLIIRHFVGKIQEFAHSVFVFNTQFTNNDNLHQ